MKKLILKKNQQTSKIHAKLPSRQRVNNRGVPAYTQSTQLRTLIFECQENKNVLNLNLAFYHASDEPLVRNMMRTVQEIAFSFSYSAKRLLRFQESLENDAESKLAMEKRTKLQSLCETRWAARADALHTFRCSFPTVVTALEDHSNNYGDAKAGPFTLAITQFGFIITLVTAEFVLAHLVPLSKMLQNKTCDLVEASKEAGILHNLVQTQRNDDTLWDDLYDKGCCYGNYSRCRAIQTACHRTPTKSPKCASSNNLRILETEYVAAIHGPHVSGTSRTPVEWPRSTCSPILATRTYCAINCRQSAGSL